MLQNLDVVLVRTRFPENIGMVARACINMGIHSLTLVAPERFATLHDKDAARPLATPKGIPLLEHARIVPDLATALANAEHVVGTTARVGGAWRHVKEPHEVAADCLPLLREDARVALVFGPEDTGLENDEIMRCQSLLTVPTVTEAASLNLAQAVLITLYTFRQACLADDPALRSTSINQRDKTLASRRLTHSERERLIETLKDVLIQIDHVARDNPDYSLLSVRRFLDKADIRRHEMDILMGICRQVKTLCHPAPTPPSIACHE